MKIEVEHIKDSGHFYTSIVEGPRIRNYENVFEREIEDAKKEIVKALTFSIRKKAIVKEYETKKIKKQQTDKIIREKQKAEFDEMTSRMTLVRKEKISNITKRNPALIPKADFTPVDNDKIIENHFGDTTKIVNRRTRLID